MKNDILAALVLILLPTFAASTSTEVDVLVYGATPGGIVSAIAAKRLLGPHSIVQIIEPLARVGGMLAGGMVDGSTSGNTRAYGGVAAEYFRRVARAYNTTDATASCFKGEPGMSELVFRNWLASEGVTLSTGQSIASLQTGANGSLVQSVTLMPSKRTVAAAQFVDASYEGDLLEQAAVPTMFGREGKARWNESFAGQGLCSDVTRNAAGWQSFTSAENASVNGSLLPGVDGEASSWDQPAAALVGDTRVQSFNFRACLTKSTAPAAAVPITKPPGYNASDFALFAHHIAAVQARDPQKRLTAKDFFGCRVYMNGKCDTNDGSAVGLNPMGTETYHWPLATPAQRVLLRQRFVNYTLGLFWFLGHDLQSPASVQETMLEYSFCADEWSQPGEDHLPQIPYVREGRRMDGGDFVFTQEDYRRRVGDNELPPAHSGILNNNGSSSSSRLDFSVGLGFWFIDCHATRLTSVGGLLQNEGCIQYGRSHMAANAVWEIPFGVMVAPKGGVSNLLSVCTLSTSHVGFQPFRVEPTYMTLGHAAGVAAALSVQHGVQPRHLDPAVLQAMLRKQGAILTAREMLPTPVTARCGTTGPPLPPPPLPPPVVSAVTCGSIDATRMQWEYKELGGGRIGITAAGSLSDNVSSVSLHGAAAAATSNGLCLTAEPAVPEPTSKHGVAVTLAACAQPLSHNTNQVWQISSGNFDPRAIDLDHGINNATLATGVAVPPHCFGSYSSSTCRLLTALAWEPTPEKTLMLWTATADTVRHPQRWSYVNGTFEVGGGGVGLCLAHYP
jgi:hypothetical protein